MIFTVPATSKQFEIPDTWWQFCDCQAFQRGLDFYLYPRELDSFVELVPIEMIEPPWRDARTAAFQKHRMVPVLMGMQSANGVVPPIEVVEQDSEPYKYTVRNGFHRYFAAAALGFTRLPVTTALVISGIKE